MRAFDNLLLAIFLIPHLVHSFQINPPGNIDVNTRAIASYKRLKGEPESWNLILRSTDSDIPDKRLVGVGISDDFEYADSVAFTCVRPGTYWIDAVSTDKSQLLNQVFARSNYIQAVRGFVLPTGTTTTSPPPPSSTSDTSKSEISTPPPTTSISEISTSSSPTFLVNNSQIELQSQPAQNSVPSNPSTPISSASTIPSALTVTLSSTRFASPTSSLIIDPSSSKSGAPTPPSESSTSGPSGSDTRRNDTSLIVGIVIGIALFLALLLGLLWYRRRRRRQDQRQGLVFTPFDGPTSPASNASTAIIPLNADATEATIGSYNDLENAHEARYRYSDRDNQAEPVDHPASPSLSTASDLPSPSMYSMSTLPEYPVLSGLPPSYIRPLPDPFARY